MLKLKKSTKNILIGAKKQGKAKSTEISINEHTAVRRNPCRRRFIEKVLFYVIIGSKIEI